MENTAYFKIGAASARLYRPDREIKSSELIAALNRAVSEINAACKEAESLGAEIKAGSGREWLLDNRYLAVREAKSASTELRGVKKLCANADGSVSLSLCDALLHACECKLTDESLRAFLTGVTSVTVLSRRELCLIPAFLRSALILRLSRAAERLEERVGEIPALFTALRTLDAMDMQKILESVDVCERLLLSDPSGVYPRMDDLSRAYYRRRLSVLAELQGVEEYRLAERLIEKCNSNSGKERHIGWYLIPESRKNGGWYIAANILFSLGITILCGFLAHSFIAALLLFLPITETTKSLRDNLLMQWIKPVQLPRLDMSAGVPQSGKTVCVVSALLTDRESGEKTAKNLESFMLSNRSGGKNLSFGILADLPEADSAVTEKDGAIIASAKESIEALNKKYGGGFYLFLRPRREDKRTRRYGGFERKRGAVLALSKLLIGEESELNIAVGDAHALRGTRFIITLDSDTRPYPDSLTELIGAMLHPLNSPVLDTERGIVTEGHGILQPRIGTTLSSASATDFSRVFAGLGGSEPYSVLCGELYMDLFHRGGFSGKGIIDAKCLAVCSNKHIPEGKILSHDAPEGAYLRGGLISDLEFSDGFPASPLSYYRRAHRWIRGDWQNAGFIFKKSSLLPDIERFRLCDSLRRSLVPVMTFLSIFLGLILLKSGLILAAAAALLALCTRLLIAMTEYSSLMSKNAHGRYHSRLIGGLGAAFMQTFLRLWLLPYEAWISLSAVSLSLWRMLISHRNLLQWETSAQSDLKKRSLAAYVRSMWLCTVSGAVLLAFSASVLAKAVGLFWLTAPLCALALSLPSKKEYALSREDKSFLIGCAEDIWRYFESFCTPEEKFLPPDNFQEQPPVGLAHRTSPTNIGLALVSALCALDLGIDRGKALPIIGGMLDTLEKLPKWQGHFYNWYDTLSLRPLNPRYVSTVDSGNLCASLITLKNGLIEHHRPALARRVAALIEAMDFSLLYDSRRRLFRIGADIGRGELSPAHYDLLASEARLTSYLAVAKGDVPKKHWQHLSRALRRIDGYRGMASWTGTMFEYLMPELFLPLIPDSLLYETARCCLHVQKKRKSPAGLWGISESAFFALDNALNYQYKAHGCADLALKRGQDRELVISPYSGFLALLAEPRSALNNLRRLESAGYTGKFGFIEAIDFTPSRCGEGGEAVRSYMVHHLGMSLLAIANAVKSGIVTRRFMAEPTMNAYKALLEEKLPVNAPVLELYESREKSAGEHGTPWTLRDGEVDFFMPNCTVLSNGKYNIMSTESGIARARLEDVLIYKAPIKPFGEGHGIEVYFDSENRRYSLLPDPQDGGSCLWELGEARVTHSKSLEGLESVIILSAAGRVCGELRQISLRADREITGKIVLSFEPVLAREIDYVNHPAYWRLGISSEIQDGALLLRRLPRGSATEYWLCLACNDKMSVSADRGGGLGALSYPLVTACVDVGLSPRNGFSLRFALCVGLSRQEAYEGAVRLLSSGYADLGVIPSMCAARLGIDTKEYGRAMELLRSIEFPRQGKKPWCAKEKLWEFGISGDNAVICAPNKTDKTEIRKSVLEFCLLRLCGESADLCIIAEEDGEYNKPVLTLVRDTLAEMGLEPLLNSHGGVHILPPSAEEAISSCAVYTVGEPAPERDTVHRPQPPNCASRKRGSTPKHEYSSDGSFVFYVNSSLPFKSYSNMLTNGRFGYLATDSGAGNMWYGNSREARINPWLNDPAAVTGAETLEFVSSGGCYSLFAANDGIPCRVKFGFGFCVWEKRFDTAAFRCTAFVPDDIDARVLIIENLGSESGKLRYKTALTLSDNDSDSFAVSTPYVNRIFRASSTRFPYDKELLFSSSEVPIGYICDEYSAVSGIFDGKARELSTPCIAAEYAAAPVTVLVCGFCSDAELLKLCQPINAFAALELTRCHWRKAVCSPRLELGGKVQPYLSGWAVYQTLACRLLGRSSLYQSGGAYGFRDQLQDAVNLMLISPKYAREQILRCCRHQYVEGDVMHWWHELPDGDKGVRSRCSDDLLWLPWALCEYAEKTDDLAFCYQLGNYVNSPVLGEHERDRYETPELSEQSESVILHAKRAIDLCVSRGRGAHGLLKFGSGDWNDGMDEVRGESVWLSFFFADTAKRFSELMTLLCMGDAHYYRGIAEDICRAADAAWDGEWYLRGYWQDGTPIGSSKSRECHIDSISQSWAAFCTGSSNSRIDTALFSALSLLYDRKNGIIKLFDPPFTVGERRVGYIESYGDGFRENGGQYTHAAIWLAIACIRRGRAEDGWAMLRSMLPENRDLGEYAAEPFVLAADIYSNPARTGEAGWTWYTGSAGWYFRAVYEELLGLKLWGGRLYIRPSLPEDFPHCLVMLGSLKIEIGEGGIFVNGEKYDGKGIPYTG